MGKSLPDGFIRDRGYPKSPDGLSAARLFENQLKPMEYDLFLFLCRNRNVAFTRNQLLDRIWGGDYEGETRTVDVHVASLRKKLKAASRIQTIPKLGYRLEV